MALETKSTPDGLILGISGHYPIKWRNICLGIEEDPILDYYWIRISPSVKREAIAKLAEICQQNGTLHLLKGHRPRSLRGQVYMASVGIPVLSTSCSHLVCAA